MSRGVSCLLAVGLAAAMLDAQDREIGVSSRKQLFIDHKFIESAEGVSLVMNPPQRTGEMLVKADAPWEKNLAIGSYSTILLENGKFRLWYYVGGRHREPGKNPDFIGVAYAESDDGIRFRKPILDLVEFEGSRKNNIVLPVDPKLMSVGGGSVMRDDNPSCPPEERYKSWQKVYPKPGSGITNPHQIWVSPEGLRWKLSGKPVTGLRAADTQPSWFWDTRIGRYVGYSREWVQFAGEGRIRMASYNESDDMHTWQKMFIAMQPDETDYSALIRPRLEPSRMRMRGESWTAAERAEAGAGAAEGKPGEDQVPPPGAPLDIYGPGVFPYPEADGVYLALVSVFHHWERRSPAAWPDTADVRLSVSRDGRHFLYPGGRRPFLRLGPSGSFDSKWIWALPRPVRVGDELWVYYFGSNSDHSSRLDPAAKTKANGISRAVMRLDGFVSADFDYSGGALITAPIRFQGSRLELNLDTGAGGVGRVEILSADGQPVPGYSMLESDQLNGNSVRMTATWKGRPDVSVLAGQPVRLHFRMRSAKLYAFQFR